MEQLTLEQLRGQLIVSSVVDNHAGLPIQDSKRSDGMWVLYSMAIRIGLPGYRGKSKEVLIREILESESNYPVFTTPEVSVSTNTSGSEEASTCATINAGDGLSIVKSLVENPSPQGFQPYAIRFTVNDQNVHDRLIEDIEKAIAEFSSRTATWLLSSLKTAVQTECVCTSTRAIAGNGRNNSGLIVEKVLLPTESFAPYTVELQLTTPRAAEKFEDLLERSRSFCGEANWLRNPIISATS